MAKKNTFVCLKKNTFVYLYSFSKKQTNKKIVVIHEEFWKFLEVLYFIFKHKVYYLVMYLYLL